MDYVAEGVFKSIANTFHCDPSSISRTTQAEDIDGWDSLTHTVLLVAIEKHFGIRLDYERVLDVEDVGGLVDFVAGVVHTVPRQ